MSNQKVLEVIEQVKNTGEWPLEYAAPQAKLTVADRGDCCHSQAYGRAVKGRDTLLFCGHHFSKHLPALLADGWRVDDQRSRITEDAKKDFAGHKARVK